MKTPWGESQSVEDIGLGIWFVTTAGHGGYYVPASLLHQIPAEHRAYAKRWSGDERWFEEDCAWAAVALAFPQLFPAAAQPLALELVEQFISPTRAKASV